MRRYLARIAQCLRPMVVVTFLCVIGLSCAVPDVAEVAADPVGTGRARTDACRVGCQGVIDPVGQRDPLVSSSGPLAEIGDWRTTLAIEDGDHSQICWHTRTGRPLGDESFIKEFRGHST